MKAPAGIVSGGNWIVDKIKIIDTYPLQDALANLLSHSVCNGGSPFNVLMALSKLGAAFPLAGVGLIGDDPEGRWIRERCKAYGVNTSSLAVHETAPTSFTDVMTVSSSGRRTFFHHRGANAFLGPEHFDFGVLQGRIFHLGYLLLLDRLDRTDPQFGTVAGRVLHAASQAGLKTSIDVVSEDSQRFAEIVLPTLPFVDYCILNEFELQRTSGVTTQVDGKAHLPGIHAAAGQLIKAGVREHVIVHFPEGACALSADGTFHLRGSIQMPPSQIAGTVGAGDAFAAGVLLGLHNEAPIGDAITMGIAAAASSLMSTTTSDSILPIGECLALENRYGTRRLG